MARLRWRKTDRFMPSLNTLVLGSVAMCLAVAGGVTNYYDRVRLTNDLAWVEHIHDVIREVHSLKYRLNMAESAALLYRATRSPNDLLKYGELTANIESTIQSVEQLTKDNQIELESAKKLRQALAPMRSDPLKAASGSGNGANGASDSPVVGRGMDIITVMGAEEYRLLQERNQALTTESQHSSVAALTYLSLSTLIVFILQILLLRHFQRQKRLEADMAVSNDLLRRKINESQALVYASYELSLCIEPKEAHHALSGICTKLVPNSSGAVALIDDSRQVVEVCDTWGNVDNFQRVFPVDSCCALRSGRLRQRKPDLSAVDCKHFGTGELTSYVCLPLSAQGETFGMLYIDCSKHEDFASLEQSITLIGEMTESASITIANLNLREKLRNQSIRDSLTGLFNRHFMEISLDREIRLAARQEQPLSVIMLDVDHFKSLNDTYGHVTGDQALQSLSFILKQNVRAEDVACRYGGEEFILILPSAHAMLAVERAELLRAKVQELRLTHEQEPIGGITISLGVATFPADGETVSDLLKTADCRLYRAKHAGRNQTVFAELEASA